MLLVRNPKDFFVNEEALRRLRQEVSESRAKAACTSYEAARAQARRAMSGHQTARVSFGEAAKPRTAEMLGLRLDEQGKEVAVKTST